METAKQLKFDLRTKSVCVKLTEDEYAKLSEMKSLTCKSIPSILRDAFFQDGVRKPTFNAKDAAKIVTELKRIGNNVNQIAKNLNAGFRAGWHNIFEECADDLAKMRMEIVG